MASLPAYGFPFISNINITHGNVIDISLNQFHLTNTILLQNDELLTDDPRFKGLEHTCEECKGGVMLDMQSARVVHCTPWPLGSPGGAHLGGGGAHCLGGLWYFGHSVDCRGLEVWNTLFWYLCCFGTFKYQIRCKWYICHWNKWMNNVTRWEFF